MVNTLGHKFRAGNEQTNSFMDLTEFCVLGENFVKILLESLKSVTF